MGARKAFCSSRDFMIMARRWFNSSVLIRVSRRMSSCSVFSNSSSSFRSSTAFGSGSRAWASSMRGIHLACAALSATCIWSCWRPVSISICNSSCSSCSIVVFISEILTVVRSHSAPTVAFGTEDMYFWIQCEYLSDATSECVM
jgi:hypothetical protein